MYRKKIKEKSPGQKGRLTNISIFLKNGLYFYDKFKNLYTIYMVYSTCVYLTVIRKWYYSINTIIWWMDLLRHEFKSSTVRCCVRYQNETYSTFVDMQYVYIYIYRYRCLHLPYKVPLFNIHRNGQGMK